MASVAEMEKQRDGEIIPSPGPESRLEMLLLRGGSWFDYSELMR